MRLTVWDLPSPFDEGRLDRSEKNPLFLFSPIKGAKRSRAAVGVWGFNGMVVAD
jgi:hypothetical protein